MSDAKKERLEKNKDSILDKLLKLGLDLKGGTHLLLEVDSSKLDSSLKTKDVVERVIEIIRNRIDKFGVAEPMIAKQGNKWIIVQLPGIKNPMVAKNLIGKTALLEFRIVNTSEEVYRIRDLLTRRGITPSQYRENPNAYREIKAIIPKNSSIFEDKKSAECLILDNAVLTGTSITNAKIEFDQFNQPVVSIEFSKVGGKVFSDITEKNIEKYLAIVLDGIVQSTPMIRSKIPNGKAVIEGDFTSEEAKLLVTILKAGALPVPIKVIEERTVGPSIGCDSIKKGFTSSLIGIMLVFIFMVVYYRFSGFIADIALCLNLIILMAIMAYFKFTLTLPGVAGIALTLAMAVDANVLILEKIREEIRVGGKSVRVAVDDGYKKVFWTIFDANFTTLTAAVFLFQFGTGPIKGFAVTLSIGLIVGMFTSMMITKLIYDFLFKYTSFEKHLMFVRG
jgi:protein-export membrane protein SecD